MDAGALTGLTPLLVDLAAQMPRLDALKAGAELYGSPRFTAFEAFRPGETALSRLIADLFDPKGLHGQGALFLNELLRDLGCPGVGHADVVRVRREALTEGGRRIDLVVETAALVIGIENKPWAGLSHRQLEDYDEALEGWKGRRRKILVLVTDSEHAVAVKDVRILRYRREDNPSLHALFSRTLPRVRSDRVKVHVAEFTRFIEAEFGEGRNVQDEAPYVDAVTAEFGKDPGRRKALAATLLAQSALHRGIVDEIGEFVLSELRSYAPDFAIPGEASLSTCLEAQYLGWYLRRPRWPANCFVGISSESGRFRTIIHGVNANAPAHPVVRSSGTPCPGRDAVETSVRGIPGGKRTPWWPWYAPAFERDWGHAFAARLVLESPTSSVADHPQVQALARQLVDLSMAIDQVHTEPDAA